MSKKSQQAKSKVYNADCIFIPKEVKQTLETFDNSKNLYLHTEITKTLFRICILNVETRLFLYKNNIIFSEEFFRCLMTENSYVNNIFLKTHLENNRAITAEYYHQLFYPKKTELLKYLKDENDFEAIINFLDNSKSSLTFE